MKKTFTLLKAISYFNFAFLYLLPAFAFAQPDYSFKNGTLVSGTNLKAGAKYRFNNVRSGVDAFVTLSYITPGITVTELDGSSGYTEALQPTLKVIANKKGYLEMKIDFLYTGTNNPFTQPRVSVTCIDIDGSKNHDGKGNGAFEFDEVDMGGGYFNYDLMGGELKMSQSGTVFRGENIAGIDYPNRDTIAKQVMFSVTNNNVSSLIVRVGIDNKSTVASTRLRSVYFKDFLYANGLLPVFGLSAFSGTAKENGVNLSWELASECNFSGITIERSLDGKKFQSVYNSEVKFSMQKQKSGYLDVYHPDGIVYYRLKLNYPDGKYNYSDVLIIKSKNNSVQGFKVYPNLVVSGASISLSVTKNENANLMVIDLGGRVVSKQEMKLAAGNNSVQLNGTNNLVAGNYLVVLTMGNERMTQKIIKR
jgi:hypothetical protein